jgi:hypothetical protein
MLLGLDVARGSRKAVSMYVVGGRSELLGGVWLRRSLVVPRSVGVENVWSGVTCSRTFNKLTPRLLHVVDWVR